jgi:transitional endoplasmic reticulum ATPase
VEESQKRQHEEDQRLLDALAAIGGSRIADEDIERKGDKLTIPERWTPKDALRFLREHIESQEEETEFTRTFLFRPFDGARALQIALKEVFGTAGIGKPTYTFFGKQPPAMISVPTGVDRTEQVPWGRLAAPLFGGSIFTGVSMHPEYGPVFQMTVETKRKFKAHVEGLFEAVNHVLETQSIYKGQAVNGAEQPEFLDLRGVDPSKVIYSDQVSTQISANVWSLLRYTHEHRERGLPLKRAVLFEGDYGTGKTLAAFLTAQLAVEQGWTFVYCRPGKDDLDMVMNTARLYQPSVVFFEDVDTIASTGDADQVTRLLDVFDGITAKGTELMCILTTNHKDRIHKGMVRPGRLDAVIPFEGLDLGGVERMIRSIIPVWELDENLDFERIAEAMGIGTEEAFLPAFAKEAIDRAARYALDRSGGRVEVLTTEDFVDAAEGLVPQLELMRGAGEGKLGDPLGKAMRTEIEKATRTVVDGAIVHSDPYGESPWGAIKLPNGHAALKANSNS